MGDDELHGGGGEECFLRSRQGLSSALASRRLRFERARVDAIDAAEASTSTSSVSSGEGRFVLETQGSEGDDGVGDGDDDVCILRCCWCSRDGEDGGELRGEDDAGWTRSGLETGDGSQGYGSGSEAVSMGEAARVWERAGYSDESVVSGMRPALPVSGAAVAGNDVDVGDTETWASEPCDRFSHSSVGAAAGVVRGVRGSDGTNVGSRTESERHSAGSLGSDGRGVHVSDR